MSDAADVSLSWETIKGTLGQFSMAVIGFVGTIVFARLLGQELLGSFYLLVALVELAERPVGGLAEAAKKRGSESHFSESEVMGVQVLSNSLWFLVIVSITFFASSLIGEYTGVRNAAGLLILLLGAEVIYGTYVPLIQSQGRIGRSIGLDALRSFVSIPVQIALVVSGFAIVGMIYGLVAGTLVVLPLAMYIYRVKPVRPSKETVVNVITYAQYSVPTAISGKAYRRFDTLLLGALLSQAAVGNYGVAMRLTLPAAFVASTISSGIFVRVSNLQSEGEEVATDINNALSFTSVIAIPLFFGALVLSDEVIRTLYSGKFSGAAPLLVGLALYEVIGTQTRPLLRIIGAFDRPRLKLYISLLGLFVNIVLGILLTLEFGTVGVVIATILAESMKYVTASCMVRRLIPKVDLLSRTFLKEVIAGGIMMIIVFIVQSRVPVRSWIGLTLLLGLGASVYGLVLAWASERLRKTLVDAITELGIGKLH